MQPSTRDKLGLAYLVHAALRIRRRLSTHAKEYTMPLTLECRTEYVRNIVKLSLWLASGYSLEGVSFKERVSAGTPIYRLTTLWNGVNHPAHPPPGWRDPCWDALLEQVQAFFSHTRRDQETASLEEEGLERLWPFLAPRIQQDLEAWPWIPSVYGTAPVPNDHIYGFFLYEIPAQPRGAHRLDLHMGNCYAPDSPLKDLQARAHELGRLLGEARALAPSLRAVRCSSWLNSFPPFQTLFPPEWRENGVPLSPFTYTYGVWGQMISRSGAYHRQNGRYLREHARFPYPALRCECTIESLLRHLCDKSEFAGRF
jgi:hypothetical protein